MQKLSRVTGYVTNQNGTVLMFVVVNLCTSWKHSYECTHYLKYREEWRVKYERCHELLQDNETDIKLKSKILFLRKQLR